MNGECDADLALQQFLSCEQGIVLQHCIICIGVTAGGHAAAYAERADTSVTSRIAFANRIRFKINAPGRTRSRSSKTDQATRRAKAAALKAPPRRADPALHLNLRQERRHIRFTQCNRDPPSRVAGMFAPLSARGAGAAEAKTERRQSS